MIKSKDYKTVVADSFEVLVDPHPRNTNPAIGLKIDPLRETPFIVPMTYDAAKSVAQCILGTLLGVAPELFD